MASPLCYFNDTRPGLFIYQYHCTNTKLTSACWKNEELKYCKGFKETYTFTNVTQRELNLTELHVETRTGTVRAPVFGRHQFFGTSEHYGKAHGSLLSWWMNYNYTACCWFPTSSNILILPSQFWQIRSESYCLQCSKCRILVLLRYIHVQGGMCLQIHVQCMCKLFYAKRIRESIRVSFCTLTVKLSLLYRPLARWVSKDTLISVLFVYIRWVRWEEVSDWSIPLFLPLRNSVYMATTVAYTGNFCTVEPV